MSDKNQKWTAHEPQELVAGGCKDIRRSIVKNVGYLEKAVQFGKGVKGDNPKK